MLTRAELQQLANDRLADAKLLLDNGHWPAAYYLAGYAVECGLKACIAALMKADHFPDKKFAEKCYTHEIEKLVILAELKDVRDADADVNPGLSMYWSVIKDWHEETRYQFKDEQAARSLYNAISDPVNGIMSWIKLHW